MEIISQPWQWYVAGPSIVAVMFLLYFFGKSFGVSSNLETLCTMGGAGRFSDYFKKDWKVNLWNIVFLMGAVIGGFIASNYLSVDLPINLNPQTISDLSVLGFENAGDTVVPSELFGMEAIGSVKGIGLLLMGGLCIGFGARWAGGCTSGHAIVGMSNLQIPSLIAVVGFFTGGIIMTWVLFPLIF
ncbi:MAG: YeeE/YedE family protein [Flavobacteriaceae bacterium]|nr:MAG: YeeE/YedE family protein [Flavobacteriaceae bacterium]